MNKIKEFIKKHMVVIVIGLLIGGLLRVVVENHRLNEVIDKAGIEETVLEPCPLCDEEVEMKPVNSSWYIKCDNCGLQTSYFLSKDWLVQYWNGGLGDE